MKRNLVVALCLTLAFSSQAQSLPSENDLSRHDFLYAGESHERRIFIIRAGKVAWSYSDPAGKGEISDTVMLASGNILFAHQFAVEEITPEKKIVWHYDAPAGSEIHTAVPIGADRVLFIQNGSPALIRIVNKRTGVFEKEIPLKTKLPVNVHPQFRHARLTSAGTLLVAHMDLDKVVEYNSSGEELWSFPGTHIWGVTPLSNGNVLITDSIGVREVTHRGDTIWNFAPQEIPNYKFDNLQQAWRLPNGNTVVNNWINEWSAKPTPQTLQLLELTPDKKVVWTLHSWQSPFDLGPATTFQSLDSSMTPENLRFGEFR
jgi:hypothetical protein